MNWDMYRSMTPAQVPEGHEKEWIFTAAVDLVADGVGVQAAINRASNTLNRGLEDLPGISEVRYFGSQRRRWIHGAASQRMASHRARANKCLKSSVPVNGKVNGSMAPVKEVIVSKVDTAVSDWKARLIADDYAGAAALCEKQVAAWEGTVQEARAAILTWRKRVEVSKALEAMAEEA